MTAAGKLAGLNAEQVAGKFTEMLASPATKTYWMAIPLSEININYNLVQNPGY